MGYIEELRALVGNRSLILAGTIVLAVDVDNQLLLHRRTDCGIWGFPGGFLELGESTEEAARREFLEETGSTAGKLRLWRVFSGNSFFHVYPNGDRVFNVITAYITNDFQGKLKGNSSESLEICFFPTGSLPQAINPLVKPILDTFITEFFSLND